MDVILNADIPVEKKIIFNEVRMHLRLITAADIVILGTGNTILPHIFNGVNHRNSSLEWPNTKPYPTKWLKVWRSLLSTFIQPKLRSNPLCIHRPFGHQTLNTFASSNHMYILWNGNRYRKHGTTRSSTYLPTNENVECNEYADIDTRGNNLILLGSSKHKQNTPQIHASKTAWDYFQRAPQWQKQIWGNAPITKDTISTIESHLLNDNISCAGDGSVKRGKAAHAWCVFRKDTYEILLKGTATVNGDYDHITSLRPETISCVAAGSFLNMIAAANDQVDSSVTFYSDNESAVINSSRTLIHDVGSAMENDIDVTIQNIRLINKAKFNFRMIHVHGHQDDNSSKLSPIADINVQMDELAGQHVEEILKVDIDTSEPTMFPSQQISVLIDGKRVHTHVEESLIFQYYKKPLEKHYKNVVKLQPSEFTNIRWNALRLTLRDSSKPDQTLKAIHSQWQTKYICKRWNLTSDAKCPLCPDSDETWEHVIKCDNIHIQRVRRECILKLNQDLGVLRTNPTLHKHILAIIEAWTTNQ